MRAITMFRGMVWLGVAVVFWSLNVRWGLETGVPNGPPNSHWERLVVGAGLLAVVAALALSISGRKRIPPSWLARGIAAACAVLVLGIGMYIRGLALGPGLSTTANALEGQGWTWLMAGGGIVLGAAVGTFGLKAPVRKSGKRGRKRR